MLPRHQAPPPIFLFVIDLCVETNHEQELQALKDSLLLSLSLIPDNSMVGLITFGQTVQVYELAFEHCAKSYVFRGNKEVTPRQVQEMLGIIARGQQPQQANAAGAAPTPAAAAAAGAKSRFVLPLAECQLTLETILDELQRDPQSHKGRPLRATGVAMAVAVSLLEASFAGSGARIMLFSSGPCTTAPGLVLTEDNKELIRSHNDILKDKAPHVAKATKYYDALGRRAATNGHVVDVFACCLDQVGVLEMRGLLRHTGGVLLQAESYTNSQFKDSFKKLFATEPPAAAAPGAPALVPALNMAFNAALEVHCSKELRICGAIGHVFSLQKKTAHVSAETEIGVGGTNAWRLCGIDPQSTVALYFEIVNQHAAPIPPGQRGLIQLLTHYQNARGQRLLRCTTVAHNWVDASTQGPLIANGFDQEAAAVLTSRIAVFKAEQEDTSAPDVLRWLDRLLIRLCNKFAEYSKDDPASFRLSPTFSLFPQFMFYLRRSHFLQVFGDSPDETTFYRFYLFKEAVASSLIMIQPTLDAYTTSGPPMPVLLSASSVAADRILLLDTFFTVAVWSGENIAAWRKAGYQAKPEYSAFKQLLQAPVADAQLIIKDRFPNPRYVECDQHTSQARVLLATVDPDVTHHQGVAPQGGEPVLSDDVSLAVFMEHLRKLAVQS